MIEVPKESLFKLSVTQRHDLITRGYTYVQIENEPPKRITIEDCVFLKDEVEKIEKEIKNSER